MSLILNLPMLSTSCQLIYSPNSLNSCRKPFYLDIAIISCNYFMFLFCIFFSCLFRLSSEGSSCVFLITLFPTCSTIPAIYRQCSVSAFVGLCKFIKFICYDKHSLSSWIYCFSIIAFLLYVLAFPLIDWQQLYTVQSL